MRTKRINRYYCDHCKKSGCSSYHMQRHEASCTANPQRTCRMCDFQRDLAPMIAILKEPGATTEEWKDKMRRVREEAEECPACILAAIRQSGVQHDLRLDNLDADSPGINGNEDPRYFPSPLTSTQDHCLGFDFKGERTAYLNKKNSANQQGYLY